jgi:hypothetical protein
VRGLITLTWLALVLTVTLYLFWQSDGETAGGHDRPYHVVKPPR